jgi:hypothetical protein
VFFGSRRHRSARGNPCVADQGDAGPHETLLGNTAPLQDWRRSAQRVTRAWNAWLAAASRDADVRYRAFVAALADEEQAAAEVERIIEPSPPGQHVTTGDPRNRQLVVLTKHY